jgi:hypothetical protein
MSRQPELAKHALSDILEGGAALAFRHPLLFLRITALLVPANAILVGLAIWFIESSEPTVLVVGLLVPAGIVSILAFLIVEGACVSAAAGIYAGSGPRFRPAITAVLERLGQFLLLAALLVVGIGPGLAFVIVLPSTAALGHYSFLLIVLLPVSLWLAGTWSVALPALVVERLGVRGSLRRSRRLTAGVFLRALGTVVFGTILALFAGVVVVLIVSAAIADRKLAEVIGPALGELLVAPLLASFAVVLYFDLRARKEGFRFD